MVALAADFGFTVIGRLWTDSVAAKGIMSRRGCGKVRHLETPTLWVQKALQDGRFLLYKIAGHGNCADLGTKHVDAATMLRHMRSMGLTICIAVCKAALRAQV